MAEKQSSILIKFGFLVGAVILGLFLVTTTLTTVKTYNQSMAMFQSDSEQQTQLLAFALAPHLFNFDAGNTGNIVEKFLVDKVHMGITVIDDKQAVFYEKKKDSQSKNIVTFTKDLDNSGTKIGTVSVLFDKTYTLEIISGTIVSSIISSLIFFIALIGVIAFLLITVVLKPLKKLDEKIVDIAHGEGDLTKMLIVSSHDEMGRLAGNFNLFISKMRQLIGGIKVTLDSVIIIRDSLGSNTQETSASLVEIKANVEGIRRQIQSLDEQIIGASSAVEEITANIVSMGKLIDEQTNAVEDSTSAVNQMVASINSVAMITESKKRTTEKLYTVTQQGGEKLKLTTGVVNEIAGNLGNISSLIKIINNISAQTNLLAMNAAIEAAHAGDAGRGFSVVADEIRKLAENSATNSKSISNILKSIVQKISEASTHGSETGKAFDLISQEVQDVNQAFSEIAASTKELSTGGAQIIHSMTTLQDVTAQVRAGSDEMEAGAQSMSHNMQNVRTISAEVLIGMQEITDGTAGIAEAVEDINQLTHQLGEASNTLKSGVSKFKIA